MRYALVAAVLGVCFPSAAYAQHDSHGALLGGHVPREVIERPLPIRSRIGRVRHPTSTTSAEAQAYYEQGLAYLHSFVWIEAARSFNHALRLDPGLALAWVGLSRALTGLEDAGAAADAQQRARALADAVSARERRWIDARDRQIEALADRQNAAKRLAYIAALDTALEHDPDDPELWTLRGNVEEVQGGAAGRGQRGGASAIAFYRQALASVPDHFGAHHYLIHSYENVGNFAAALKHGEVYAAAASSVPHALHMHGHDLMKTGRMTDAIEIFLRARKLEHEYYAAERIKRDYDWHHAHNTALLALSYRHTGRVSETEHLLRDAASVQQPSDVRTAYYRALHADLLIARGEHAAALDIASELAGSKAEMPRTLGNAIAARARLAAGQIDAARSYVDALGTMDDSNMYGAFASLEVDLARGEFLLRTGKREEGTRVLTDALTRARRQRTPDGWIEGLFFLEAIFHVARHAGDWALARTAAARLIEHDPAYGGSQYAAGIVAEQAGDRAAAATAFAESARLWSGADAAFVQSLRPRGSR